MQFGSFTDVHNIRDTSTDYFEHFSQYDQLDFKGRRHSCIGCTNLQRSLIRAHSAMHGRVCIRKILQHAYSDMACLNSGATGDMLNHVRHFGKDYRPTKDLFVYMGDGTPIKVDGTGTV